MSTFIRLHMEAVQMSWGLYAPRDIRPSSSFVSRSATGGLLGAAQGLDRLDPRLDDLHRNIRVSSRVLRQGTFTTEIQNKKATYRADPYNHTASTKMRRQAMRTPEVARGQAMKSSLTRRTYLNDAAFEVVVEIRPNCPFSAEELIEGLHYPRFPLYFGRKHCIPSVPVVPLDAGPIEAEGPLDVFRRPTVNDMSWVFPDDGTDPNKWLRERYPLGDPAKHMFASLDTPKMPEGHGPVVKATVRDAMFHVRGRVFRERVAYIINQPKES